MFYFLPMSLQVPTPCPDGDPFNKLEDGNAGKRLNLERTACFTHNQIDFMVVTCYRFRANGNVKEKNFRIH